MKKPTIAVVFGSRSTEHDISVLTAIAAVIKPLQLAQKYDVLPVYITKDGRWFAGKKFADIKTYQGDVGATLAKQSPVSLTFGKNGGLQLAETGKRFKPQTWNIDVVFPATHGTHGEDGELMAICEMANVPYVGCDVESSVIAMDKVLAKQVVLAAGLNTPKYVAFSKQGYEADSAMWVTKINKSLTYPLFVKPAHLGSSIGITRVAEPKDLANAIEVALHYDTKALVEEGVNNLVEVTLPIMGNEELVAAYLEQPLTTAEDFFDFDTKYIRGGKGKGGKAGGKSGKEGAQGYSQIPADLPKDLYQKAETVGLDAFRAIGCTGFARIDMLIDSHTKTVYFNEVNPMPGSLYAHNWRKKGISNVALVTQLIELAIARHHKKQELSTAFASNFLKQF
ncbi:MAG TPA: D-alanine--D-alanine ligase family protein [Candidatus Saccharimonadales bacterium]|nr:D-alanine--D-alanine ligase family protein [Candidatus Saccharimonadales bacterium]